MSDRKPLTPEQRLHVAIREKDVRAGHRLTQAEALLVFEALAEMTQDCEDRNACIVNIATCEDCKLCEAAADRDLVKDAREWAKYDRENA